MKSRFSYLLDKIMESSISNEPFKHIEINDFLSPSDFAEIISTKELDLGNKYDDFNLFETLFTTGYKMVPFPGAITDHKKYIKSRIKGNKIEQHSACESAGVVLRLTEPKSQVLIDLKEFISSIEFNSVLAEKFNVQIEKCTMDSGLQKYLDGYEISPHPDLRKKALTFMVNINSSPYSEKQNHHTHYMKFNKKYEYVNSFWQGNSDVERCWVPWDWCQTVKQQSKNNSIVVFAPSNDTIHAVKADYDHSRYQRTQIYGNLWYLDKASYGFKRTEKRLDWWDIDLSNNKVETQPKNNIKERVLNKFNSIFKSSKISDFIDDSRKNNY